MESTLFIQSALLVQSSLLLQSGHVVQRTILPLVKMSKDYLGTDAHTGHHFLDAETFRSGNLVKIRSKRGQGKVKTRSRIRQGKSKQGQGKSKQGQGNATTTAVLTTI